MAASEAKIYDHVFETGLYGCPLFYLVDRDSDQVWVLQYNHHVKLEDARAQCRAHFETEIRPLTKSFQRAFDSNAKDQDDLLDVVDSALVRWTWQRGTWPEHEPGLDPSDQPFDDCDTETETQDTDSDQELELADADHDLGVAKKSLRFMYL